MRNLVYDFKGFFQDSDLVEAKLLEPHNFKTIDPALFFFMPL